MNGYVEIVNKSALRDFNLVGNHNFDGFITSQQEWLKIGFYQKKR